MKKRQVLPYPMSRVDIVNSITKPYQYQFYRHPTVQENYNEWMKLRKKIPNKNNKTLLIKKNNFPYYLEAPYKHYVAWYNGKWKDSQLHLYKERLQQKYKKAFIFINLPQARSINNLPHFHIISKIPIPCIVLNVMNIEELL